MPSPFPGMDPYLEDPEIWPGFHHRLADEIAGQLTPLIGPEYYADVSLRAVNAAVRIGTAHVTYPDAGVFRRAPGPGDTTTRRSSSAVAIPAAPVERTVPSTGRTTLRAVHLYRTGTGQLVTSIEILSPYNKRGREGLDDYRDKRTRILGSAVHLVEIDLLRAGERPGPEVVEPPLDTDYVLLVNRFREEERSVSEIWPVSLNERVPLLPVPLLPPDPAVALDLKAAIDAVYDRAGYAWRIDYGRPPPPPEPRAAMAAWLESRRAG